MIILYLIWDSFFDGLKTSPRTCDNFKKDRVLVPTVVHRCGSDELFVGRAGYLSGALWLNSELKSDIVPQTDLFLICNSIVQSGREYVRRKGSRKQVSNSIFLLFLKVSKSQLFFSNLNDNCSDVLNLRNLQEQVKKHSVLYYQAFFSANFFFQTFYIRYS